MGKIPDHLNDFVQRASEDPALLDSLSDEMVPVMMHLPLDQVHQYRIELEPLLDTLTEGSAEFTYLAILIAFLDYRRSNYNKSLKLLSSYAIEHEDTFSYAMAVSINTLIGASYRSLGQAEFALEYFQRNIPYTQIERNDHSYFYSLTIYHIAELFGELGEYDSMLDRHMLNLQFFDKDEYPDFYYRTLNGVGRAHRGLKEYDDALVYLLKAKEESEQKGNLPFRTRNLHDLGSLYAELNKIEESLAYFEKALELRKKNKLVNASISTVMEMGRLLIDSGRVEEAVPLLEQAFEEAKQYDVKKKQFQICKLLSEAYEDEALIEEALDYYKKFHAIKELVDNVHYTKAENQRVREINTVLEEQKKLIEEQHIKIEESHQSIQVLNENLEALVHERTQQLLERSEQLKHYAFMNAHEVRGPLSTILGLLEIANEFSSPEEKDELIEMIKEPALKLDATLKNMHQNLVKFNEGPEVM